MIKTNFAKRLTKVYTIGLKRDNEFAILLNENESLDLLGVELCKVLNIIIIINILFSNTFFAKFYPSKKVCNLILIISKNQTNW